MLLGAYQHNLQSKRRLAMPAQFRQDLGEKAIITQGLEPCLMVLPFNIWQEMTRNLGNNPLLGGDKRDLRRLLAHNAYPIEFDSQGRILIPDALIEAIGLEKKVTLTGSIDWVEVWKPETYKEYMQGIEGQRVQIAERISQ